MTATAVKMSSTGVLLQLVGHRSKPLARRRFHAFLSARTGLRHAALTLARKIPQTRFGICRQVTRRAAGKPSRA
ncbi:MAG TPA: hypothetical protein VH375_03790, partial [Rhodanobacteraceae bacterium]